MHVVVGGGGSAADEADVLERFAVAMGDHARVLNLPWAQADPAAPRIAAWAWSTLGAHGVSRVDTAISLDAAGLDLDSYDGVFMGGGNTFLLVHRLRDTGLAARLVRSIQEGLPCYGGSAGAIDGAELTPIGPGMARIWAPTAP